MVNTELSDVAEASSSVLLSLYYNNQENLRLNRSQNLLLLNHQWLSPCLVDALAEVQQNWINRVQHDWTIEVYSLDLLGVTQEIDSLKHCYVTIEEIVELTSEAPHQHFVVSAQAYYCYTCCLHIAGLGRVRLVIAFDNAERIGDYGVLLTNCLAWSPQTILSHWLKSYSPELFYRNSIAERRIYHSHSSEMALCRSIA